MFRDENTGHTAHQLRLVRVWASVEVELQVGCECNCGDIAITTAGIGTDAHAGTTWILLLI